MSATTAPTPFAATLPLLINSFATPPVYQAGYVPLPILANANGDVPSVAPPAGVNNLPTFSLVTNTGPSASTVPWAAVFDSSTAAVGSYAYTVSCDGAECGTITVVVSDTLPQVVGAGTPVVLPLGQPIPTTLSF